MSSTEPTKDIWIEDAEKPSNFSLVNLFCIGGFPDTKYPTPFYFLSSGVIACPGAETDMAFWRPGRIRDSLFAAP